MAESLTPLEKSLKAPPKPPRAKPIDVLKLARKKWLKGERINLGVIAEELGIGRATLSRWVGSKDRLLAEILWSLYEPIFIQAKEQAKGKGPDYVAEVYRLVMQAMLDAKPLQTFVVQDMQYALGVLTASSIVQKRRINSCKTLLEEQVALGHLHLPLDVDTTAFVITRLNESFVYSDALTGETHTIDKAVSAIRILTGSAAPLK